ncbi:hypothetical protein F5X99DRAFT_430529 [Biscogniauxia marginata]|nr:hypothetical protein F5X99DRAFT_430529 [Biscogniauxia marginata]
MRGVPVLVFCLGALLPAIAAQSLDNVPDCGFECILPSVLNSGCDTTDAACICSNTQLMGEITQCMASNCSIRDQLSTLKYSNDFCGVEGEDRRVLVWAIAIAFGALGLLAFGLRCFARLFGSRSWGWDDTVMCFAMCFEIPLAVLSIPLTQHGLGLDIWNVPFDDITEILHIYFFDEMIYIAALSLTKVSILLFYLKLFPKRSFRICTWFLIAANIIYALTYVFLLIFQCNPIQGAWLFWDGEFEAQCLSINVLSWSAAAINILLDLAVIILPLPELFQLSLSLRKKLQIMAMFAVGFFITVVSIVRLRSLIQFGTTQNLTQDYVEVGYWSTIEVPVGVMCACMPAIRSLFSLAFPRMFGSTDPGRSGYYPSSSSKQAKLASSPGNHHQIKVEQEWTVLVDPADERGSHTRHNSDVELVRVGTTTTAAAGNTDIDADVFIPGNDVPTRKLTLKKEGGERARLEERREERRKERDG